MDNDIYVAYVYNVPEGSGYHDDEIYNLLNDQMFKIQASAEIALYGAYSAPHWCYFRF